MAEQAELQSNDATASKPLTSRPAAIGTRNRGNRRNRSSFNPIDEEKYKTDIKNYDEEIEKLEAVLKEDDDRRQQSGALRSDREAKNNSTQSIKTEIESIKMDIRSHKNGMSKMRLKLPHTREDQLNDTIQRLEYQLMVHTFDKHGEKKIVNEIESLKKSTKLLREYQALEKVMATLLSSQHELRSQLDVTYEELRDLKRREEEIKRQINDNRELVENARKELETKRSARDNRYQQFQRYRRHMQYQQRKAQRPRQPRRQRPNDRQDGTTGRHSDASSFEFEQATNLCDRLVNCLQKLSVAPDEAQEGAAAASASAGDDLTRDNELLSAAEAAANQAGMFVHRRPEFDSGAKSKPKRKPPSRHRLKDRSVTLSSSVIGDLNLLGVRVPLSNSDVNNVIEELRLKKDQLNSLRSNRSSASLNSFADSCLTGDDEDELSGQSDTEQRQSQPLQRRADEDEDGDEEDDSETPTPYNQSWNADCFKQLDDQALNDQALIVPRERDDEGYSSIKERADDSSCSTSNSGGDFGVESAARNGGARLDQNEAKQGPLP